MSPSINVHFELCDLAKWLPWSHRGQWQIKTLSVLEFDQDLLAVRPVKLRFKEKHTVNVTTDSHICVASEEKVKHIVYLKMPKSAIWHKVGTPINHTISALQFSHYPYLSWHSPKETKHPANTYSVKELFQFSSKAESSKPPHHSVGSAGTAMCLRTVTECNSWTNNRTKNKIKWTHSRDSRSYTAKKQVDFCPPLSFPRVEDVHNAAQVLMPWGAVSSQLQPLQGKANHFNMLRRLSWITVWIHFLQSHVNL